jgi:hypothetical protein
VGETNGREVDDGVQAKGGEWWRWREAKDARNISW